MKTTGVQGNTNSSMAGESINEQVAGGGHNGFRVRGGG